MGAHRTAALTAGTASSGCGHIRTTSLICYCALAAPLAFAGLPIYLHAPDYYAATLGQSLTSLGTILLALRLVDAIQDPLIGRLSDRFHKQRILFILFGALLLGAGFWMLFHPHSAALLLWFAASVLICTTGYSVVTINFQALGGLWPVASSQRTLVTAAREGLGLLGLLAAALAPALLAPQLGQSRAFHYLSLVLVPLLAGGVILLMVWRNSEQLSTPPISQKRISWRQLLMDRWRATFFTLVLLNTFASSVPAVLVLFFIRDRMGAEAYTGLFLLIYFLSGTVSMPLWIRLAAKLGKLRAWQLSLLLAICTFIWAVFLGRGDIMAYVAVCALSGLALGADLALPPAILADHIDRDKRHAEASSLFSMMALASKMSLAAATGLALPLLGELGYIPGGKMSARQDWILSLTYAAVPCGLKLATLAGLRAAGKTLAKRKSGI